MKLIYPRKKIHSFVMVFTLLLLVGFATYWLIKNPVWNMWNVWLQRPIYGFVGQPIRINPLLHSQEPLDEALSKLIYRSLIIFDETSKPTGDLADRWEISEDQKAYTVFLKPDQYWHDHQKITADDVLYTFQLTQSAEYNGPEKSRFQGVTLEKIDDLTVKLILTEPFSPFLENLTLSILPQHIWKSLSTSEIQSSNYNLEPVGSGKLRIEKVTTQVSPQPFITEISLNDNPYDNFTYKHGKLLFRFFQNEEELRTAYALGEITGFFTDQEEVKANYEKNWPNTTNRVLPICGETVTIFYNLTRDQSFATNNTNLKTAIYYLLNQGSVNLKPFDSPISSTNWAYSRSEEAAYDANKIKETLDQNHTTDPLALLAVDTAYPEQQIAQDLTSILQRNNVNINLELVSIDKLKNEVLPERKFDLLAIHQKYGSDPDQYHFWHSTQTDLKSGTMNIAGYTNRVADKALEDGRKTNSEEERKAAYSTLQKRLFTDQPALFLPYPPIFQITRKNLQPSNQIGCLWHSSDYLLEALD
jgi:peptide/nickel transport system substrate-binding protein